MAVQQSQIQKKGQQSVAATPTSTAFQSRPFEASQAEVEQSAPNDLQAQLQHSQQFGHSFANTLRVAPSNIQAKLTIGQPNDKYEQEADRVAAQVVDHLNTPKAMPMPKLQTKTTLCRKGSSSSSQQEPAESRLQMKPLASSIQRLAQSATPKESQKSELKLKPSVQRRSDLGEAAASTNLESEINQARGGGQSISTPILQPMEQSFGANFSSVRIHTDNRADQLSRSINAQAFTTKNDIFFSKGAYSPHTRNGQELLAHELTHVVQQQGDNVQRMTVQPKLREISRLPEEAVTKSGKLEFATASEKIQKKIDEYYPISFSDKDYKKQRRILTDIISLSKNWIKENQKDDKKAHRVPHIAKVTVDAEIELATVEQQEERDKGGQNDYKKSIDPFDALSQAATMSQTGAEIGVPKEAKVGSTVGSTIGSTIAGDGNSLAEQSKSLFSAIKTSADTDDSLFDEKNIGTKSIVENYRDIADLNKVDAGGKVIGPKVLSLSDALFSWKTLGSVLGVAKNLYHLYTAWNEWRAFANAQKEIKEGDGDEKLAALKDAIMHGCGKIRRRFWGIVTSVVLGIIDIVSYILVATGVGAAVGSILNLGTTILSTLASVGRKLKGIWKHIKGIRGKHRERSADTLVQQALKGDPISLKLLVTLDPLGIIGRAKIGAKRGYAEGREQGNNFAGKVVKGLDGALGEVIASGIDTSTPEKMKVFLQSIKGNPQEYGININEFTKYVSAGLKSQ